MRKPINITWIVWYNNIISAANQSRIFPAGRIWSVYGKFWERGKSPGWHWWVKRGSRGLTRVLTQPWPWVDQGVSLGVVGDVFEVMAQVDRRLTKVNSVVRIIRVNQPDRKPGASHILFIAFQQKNPLAKKPLMSRVWWCSYHPTGKTCWVLVYSVLL
jgi:hypothetical protein